MKQIPLFKFMPGIAWFFIVLILIVMPGRDIPSAQWFDDIQLDKLIHAGIFGLLALLFMVPVIQSSLPARKIIRYCAIIAIATCVWGLATEFIQKYLVTARSFDLLDWLADTVGAVIAYYLATRMYLPRVKS